MNDPVEQRTFSPSQYTILDVPEGMWTSATQKTGQAVFFFGACLFITRFALFRG
jgi:hypothetical protein